MDNEPGYRDCGECDGTGLNKRGAFCSFCHGAGLLPNPTRQDHDQDYADLINKINRENNIYSNDIGRFK